MNNSFPKRDAGPILPPQTRSIAILSDIHGNIRALEAVLDDLAEQNVDEVVCNGDLITSSAHTKEVVSRIRALGIPSSRGNHERYLFELDDPHHIKWQQANWAPTHHDYHVLDSEERQWLCNLPDMLWLYGDGAPLFMAHGAPGNDTGRVNAQLTASDWSGIFSSLPPGSTLVGSHLHWFWQHRWQGYHFVRTPSTGLPLDGDQRAGYVIMRRTGQSWQVEQRRVSYDLTGELSAFKKSDYYHEGGVIAQLFYEELRTARWRIVPYFAHLRQVSPYSSDTSGNDRYSHAELEAAWSSFDPTLFPAYDPDALSVSS